jgi:hypothetical protein
MKHYTFAASRLFLHGAYLKVFEVMGIYLVALRLVVVDSLLSKSPTSFQLNHYCAYNRPRFKGRVLGRRLQLLPEAQASRLQ